MIIYKPMPKWRIAPTELIRILQQNGFVIHHQKWSHCMLKNPNTWKYTIVPMHNKELWIWLTLAILKQAWIDRSVL